MKKLIFFLAICPIPLVLLFFIVPEVLHEWFGYSSSIKQYAWFGVLFFFPAVILQSLAIIVFLFLKKKGKGSRQSGTLRSKAQDFAISLAIFMITFIFFIYTTDRYENRQRSIEQKALSDRWNNSGFPEALEKDDPVLFPKAWKKMYPFDEDFSTRVKGSLEYIVIIQFKISIAEVWANEYSRQLPAGDWCSKGMKWLLVHKERDKWKRMWSVLKKGGWNPQQKLGMWEKRDLLEEMQFVSRIYPNNLSYKRAIEFILQMNNQN